MGRALQNIPISRFFIQLFGLALLIRFPFFFRDYIDWDETTFLLLAQSWVDGHLPYTELWDLKPPLTFLFFAVQLWLFGKNMILIRLSGVFLVAGIAWFSYQLIDRLQPELKEEYKKLSAILTLLLCSLFGTLQGVMSEHISTFFFMGGLVWIVKRSGNSLLWALGAGIMMGLGVMSKLNLAYPILALGLYLLSDQFQRPKKTSFTWKALVLWAFGGLLVVVLTYLPYAIDNLGGVWWQSVVEAPMAYGSVRGHFWETLLVCLPIFGLLVYGLYRKGTFGQEREAWIMALTLGGVLFSFIQAGRINGHYLIQAYPLLVILLLAALCRSLDPPGRRARLIGLILLVMIPIESYREYGLWINHRSETGRWFRGESYELARYLQERSEENASVFYLHYHTAGFLLGQKPVSRAGTHPSNLTRDELFEYMNNPRLSSKAEIKYVFEVQQPEYVVVKRNKIFSKKFPELNAQTQAYLDQEYAREVLLGRALIYKRKDSPTP